MLDRQDFVTLHRRLRRNGDFVGEPLPPDTGALSRFLIRLGWIPRSINDARARLRAGTVSALMAKALGIPEEEACEPLHMHAARICGVEPLCGGCPVADLCRSYRARPGIRDLPPALRPRERLLRAGPALLSDADLLALVLGGGSSGRSSLDLAGALLARFRDLRRLGTRTPYEVTAVRGVGPAKAASVLAALELGRRLASSRLDPGRRFSSSRDLFEHFGPRMRDAAREVFLTILLDGRNRVLHEVRVSEGSLTASLVHPREAFNLAIRESAVSVAFVHNHPSGDPSPSRQDVEITHRLVRTGELVGIRVLDHVILGEEAWFSFADHGMLVPGPTPGLP